jgi:hypothetical protein
MCAFVRRDGYTLFLSVDIARIQAEQICRLDVQNSSINVSSIIQSYPAISVVFCRPTPPEPRP